MAILAKSSIVDRETQVWLQAGLNKELNKERSENAIALSASVSQTDRD